MNNFPPLPLFTQPSSPSFSRLPDEIVESFLAWIPISYYYSLSKVSKSFYSLLVSGRKIYTIRSQIGATEPCLYVCLWLPWSKNHSWFSLITPAEAHTSQIQGLLRPKPVRISSSYDPARLNSSSVTVGFEIYQMGGTVGGKRSRAVDVLDCRSHTWRRAPDLTVARESAKSWFLDRKIYVTGGEEKGMIWGEALDIKTQTWKALPSPSPSENESDHQVVVLGGRLCVVAKHNDDKYAYDPIRGRWVREMGFLGLVEPILSGRCCVIDNVLFAEHGRKFKWYDSRYGDWLMVEGLQELYAKRCRDYQTVQLVNHGGKLVIVWHQWKMFADPDCPPQYRNIWCAVIRLEERRVTPSGTQIWGDIERCNIVVYDIPKSYKLLSCLSVSI